MEVDVVIIGSGVGGYTAALRGAQLGLKIALVEKNQLGGTCVNHGCIPTKALVNSAQMWEGIKNSKKFGFNFDNYSLNYSKIVENKDTVVNRLSMGVSVLLRARKVNIIKGIAEIINPKEVIVYNNQGDKETIKTKNIIIATGSKIKKIPIEGLDNKNVFYSEEILKQKELPKNMLIIGGGYSGIEFASIFNSFDVKVEVVDILDRILLQVDKEVATSLLGFLKKRGINFSLSSSVKNIIQKGEKVAVYVGNNNGEKEIIVDRVLVSTGRVPDFGGLNVEKLGIELEGEGIKVDKYLKTSIPGIYAIGDVTAKVMLAHVASMQGQVAINNIIGEKNPMSYKNIPFCVFSSPEVASVGLTEKEASEEFTNIKIFKFPYLANGKAISMNQYDGYIKMIAQKNNNQIIGVHIIGAHASDLIAETTLAIQKGCTAKDIADTIHAHPTLPEIIAEAAEGILGHPIHVVK
jgi:dihydrolipoamide dehydrogenase